MDRLMNWCGKCRTWGAATCECTPPHPRARSRADHPTAYSEVECGGCGQVKLLYRGIYQCLHCDLLTTKIALLTPPAYNWEVDGECG
jgi:hypothetical protein